MVLNATFNNILVISWRLALLVEETGGPRENHWEEGQAFQNWQHKRGRLASNHTLIPLSKVDMFCFHAIQIQLLSVCSYAPVYMNLVCLLLNSFMQWPLVTQLYVQYLEWIKYWMLNHLFYFFLFTNGISYYVCFWNKKSLKKPKG